MLSINYNRITSIAGYSKYSRVNRYCPSPALLWTASLKFTLCGFLFLGFFFGIFYGPFIPIAWSSAERSSSSDDKVSRRITKTSETVETTAAIERTMEFTGPMELIKYLSLYLSYDEYLKNADLQVKVSQSDLDKASDLYQSQWTLSPSLAYDNGRQARGTLQRTTTRLQGGLTQKWPSGTRAQWSAIKHMANTSSSMGMGDEYSLSVRQELMKNFLGRLDLEIQSQAKSELRLSQLRHQNQALESCYTGTKLFINAYHSQQNLRILEEMLKDAKKTLQISERSYKKKMLRKIDILSARADRLRIEGQTSLAQKNYDQRVQSLFTPISHLISMTKPSFPSSPSFQFVNPKSIFQTLEFKSPSSPRESLAYQQGEQRVFSSESKLNISKESARNQMDFQWTLGHRNHGAPFLQAQTSKQSENYIIFGLNMEWPLINKTRGAMVAKAQYERDMAIQNRQRILEEVTEQQAHFLASLKSSRERLNMSRQKMKLYDQQIREARRLFQNGSLEFEDYIRYRDIYLNEKLQMIFLQNEQWHQQTQLALLQNNMTHLCPSGGGPNGSHL